VEIAHARQLGQQGEVAEVETESARLHLACASDSGRGVGVGVARVPEPAVGLDGLDERRRKAVGRLLRQVDALKHTNVCSPRLRV
jgi:hypothetical protein